VLIAVTCWGKEADRRKSLIAGFDAHLAKPVNIVELERILAQCARAHQELSQDPGAG
jgi:CheY-like chemotaxis protein